MRCRRRRMLPDPARLTLKRNPIDRVWTVKRGRAVIGEYELFACALDVLNSVADSDRRCAAMLAAMTNPA